MTDAWEDMKKAKEDQYFMEKDKELLDKKRRELEMEEFKKHFRNHCPKCGEELVEEEFHGVNIDRCRACNGVWLDNGELETLTSAEKAMSWFEKFWGSR